MWLTDAHSSNAAAWIMLAYMELHTWIPVVMIGQGMQGQGWTHTEGLK